MSRLESTNLGGGGVAYSGYPSPSFDPTADEILLFTDCFDDPNTEANSLGLSKRAGATAVQTVESETAVGLWDFTINSSTAETVVGQGKTVPTINLSHFKEIGFRARIDTASAGGASYRVMFGLFQAMSVEDFDHLVFDYDSNNYSDQNWRAESKNTPSETTTDTGVAASTSFQNFRIRKDGSNYLFYIDGTLVATHSTNIPDVALEAGVYVGQTNSSTATNHLYLDFAYIRYQISRGSI